MNERSIHRIFEVSILLKGAHALIECAGGLLLAFIGISTIASLVKTLTQEELIEDPHDLVATSLMNFAQNFSVSTEHFCAFYLLSHGIGPIILTAFDLAVIWLVWHGYQAVRRHSAT